MLESKFFKYHMCTELVRISTCLLGAIKALLSIYVKWSRID